MQICWFMHVTGILNIIYTGTSFQCIRLLIQLPPDETLILHARDWLGLVEGNFHLCLQFSLYGLLLVYAIINSFDTKSCFKVNYLDCYHFYTYFTLSVTFVYAHNCMPWTHADKHTHSIKMFLTMDASVIKIFVSLIYSSRWKDNFFALLSLCIWLHSEDWRGLLS